jgi:hypothetical protein
MILKLARVLLVGFLLVVSIGLSPVVCRAWSVLHPFTPDPPPKQTFGHPQPKPQSTWDKATSGAKNLMNKTGEAVGLKKPDKKPMPQYAYVKPPLMQQKKPESTSWFGSMFKSSEPEKPKTVGEWMGSTKRIDP